MTQSLDRPGGVGRFFPFAKALTQAGHTVEIVTLHQNYESLKTTQFNKEGIQVRYVGQMHILQQESGKTYFGPGQLLYIVALATLKLTWHAIRSDAQIIQVCKPQPMNCVAAWVARLLSFGRKQIFIDCDDYEAGNNRFSGGWQQKIVSWFEDRSPKRAEIVFTGNRFIFNHFESLGYPADRFTVLHNGVDKERFAVLEQPNLTQKLAEVRETIRFSADDHLVIYVGSISLTSHALDLLIEAFTQLAAERDDVNLLIAGSGEDFDPIQELIKQNSLTERVNMLGRVDSALIPFYFNVADISVDPMHRSIAAESSVSMKMLESIAAGTPCVTTDIGDRKALGAQSVRTVPPDDPAVLAQMLSHLLDHPAKLDEMKRAAASEKERHFWENKIQPLLPLYEK